MKLQGIGVSSGIGIGVSVCVRDDDLDYSHVGCLGPTQEKARLQEGIAQFTQKTFQMAENIRVRVGQKESEILTGQVVMLSDPFMQSQMEEIIDAGQCAEAAVDQVCTMYAQMFAGVEDELMRQRATDVQDIRARMLSILLGRTQVDLGQLPDHTVLVVHDLTPSMTVGLNREQVAAIVTEVGGRTSHSAILARALELPTVLSVPDALEHLTDGSTLIVDGDQGTVLSDPEPAQLAHYQKQQAEYARKKALLEVYRHRATVDAQGNPYALYANIGSPAEAKVAAASGAEGIGLFRTEFLFMDRTSAPTEEEQFEAYRSVSQTMAGKEVIIRTLDVGGDKAVDYLGMEAEDNPFLGHRAIRYCLDRPDLYRTQLRALLRASAEEKNIKIMLPLVTCVEEIQRAKELLDVCKAELEAEGIPYHKDICVGTMIETPAAALIADLLAQECDFFSIGTNDLTGYTMAVDRGNAQVAQLYTTFQPAVLRSIHNIITAAKQAGIPVGMCGESAADPKLIPLLMAWGLDEFSVSASAILPTRATIHQWTLDQAQQVAQQAMERRTASQVYTSLAQATTTAV